MCFVSVILVLFFFYIGNNNFPSEEQVLKKNQKYQTVFPSPIALHSRASHDTLNKPFTVMGSSIHGASAQ